MNGSDWRNSRDPKDYDTLECPQCDQPTEAVLVSRKFVVRYTCQECEISWQINADGDLIE